MTKALSLAAVMLLFFSVGFDACDDRTCTQRCMDNPSYKSLELERRVDVCQKACHVRADCAEETR